MSLLKSYATKAQLAEYLEIEIINLQPNSERLIKRASELVDEFTMGKINLTTAEHEEAAMLATCAQVEFLLTVDESMDIISPPSDFSLGSFKLSGTVKTLAPRARRYLFLAGLMYRGC